MRRRKTDLSKHSRRARKERERRALRRQKKWMESVEDSISSFTEIGKERIATSCEMEANWQAFSIAVARSKIFNALDMYRNQNNHVSIPQPPFETFVKQEVQESLMDSVNSVKLEFETQEDMERRLSEETHFENVGSIITVKVEQEE